tara:strand:+ start:198 stop:368 length:171 start_codon:yes stop_codon:yes gene_type:complete
MMMRYLVPTIASLIFGGLFSWTYFSVYGFDLLYLLFVAMIVGVVFLGFDAWSNKDK